MANLFKGVAITFSSNPIDNRANNAHLRSIGLNHNTPDFTNRIEFVESYVAGCNGNFKLEREFTRRENGEVTLYVSGSMSVDLTRSLEVILKAGTITGLTYGSMQSNATFKPSKAKR